MKYIYAFKEGNKNMRNILGGKGANLAEMIHLGLPVPNGFTITTDACLKYYEDNETVNDEIKKQLDEKLEELENETGKKLGNEHNPLLVSVRSGARASMPGMMDTILNLGLNDKIVETLAKDETKRRFAYDSYRRLIQMFADVVMNFPKSSFERIIDKIKEEKGIQNDLELTEDDMQEIVHIFKKTYKDFANEEFPQDPKKQILEAIQAVFRSWNSERAITYRKLNDIPSDWGTAVNIQQMVYGNIGEDSGTGVAFTRNPATGEKKLYGEYLINAQGEDIVAGIRTPESIETLENSMPEIYQELKKITTILEEHYKDMQDMEFTIEHNKLYMLQTRNGKRTATAAVRIAVDLVKEKKITKEEALLKVEPRQLDQLLHPTFDKESLQQSKIIAKGLAASPGAATGKIVFQKEDVIKLKEQGEKNIILVRLETSPEDIEGMHLAKGILTVRGGMTSHAAVVARGMGICCICGCTDLIIDEQSKTITTKEGITLKEYDNLSLDGETGNVYGESIKTIEKEISGDFKTFMEWVDQTRTMEVRANADTPKDIETALKFGAQGIGLCRTEHMFFEEKRIFAIRQMITAETKEQRAEALKLILPMQRKDFEEMFRVSKGLPVTIRLLDPPLHEFLPKKEEEIPPLAQALGISEKALKERIASLHEFNPMMGHRGCRLAVTYPEIAEMQTRAIMEAAINIANENIAVKPEIMIPLIGDVKELKYIKEIITNTIEEVVKEKNKQIKYEIGTMIEIPRAALLADEIAKEAEFFSFGTNDLTQLTYGFSRDDASKFLKDYYDKQILEYDPFTHIDEKGTGKLIEIAAEKGRKTRPNIELGICGEHGGDPKSIAFCQKVGLTYVSCSPYRVPIARLAAAQAAIKFGMQK